MKYGNSNFTKPDFLHLQHRCLMKVMKFSTWKAKKIMSIHTSIWRAIDVNNLDKMLSILYLLIAILCHNHNCDGLSGEEECLTISSDQLIIFWAHLPPVHVTSSLIGILLYDLSARYKKNPEILSHENEANNSCKCKMQRREWMVTLSWILYTIENFLQFF
jgi:hypothetical protein